MNKLVEALNVVALTDLPERGLHRGQVGTVEALRNSFMLARPECKLPFRTCRLLLPMFIANPVLLMRLVHQRIGLSRWNLYVFPDTNIFLHHQPFDQIRWTEVLKVPRRSL